MTKNIKQAAPQMFSLLLLLIPVATRYVYLPTYYTYHSPYLLNNTSVTAPPLGSVCGMTDVVQTQTILLQTHSTTSHVDMMVLPSKLQQRWWR